MSEEKRQEGEPVSATVPVAEARLPQAEPRSPETSPATSDAEQTAPASAPSQNAGLLLAGVALLAALLGGGYTALVVKPALDHDRTTVAQVAAQLPSLTQVVQTQQALLAALERQVAGLAEQGARLAAVQEQLATVTEATNQSRERLAKLEAAVEQLHGIAQSAAEMTAALARVGDRRWLVEAAETLAFAERQLAWNGNLEAVQAALALLAERLATADRPLLRPLKEAVEADLLAVRAAPRVDRDRLVAKLAALGQTLDEAALAFAAPVAPEKQVATGDDSALWYQQAWAKVVAFGRAVGQEWAHWLRLERLDAAAPELLSPQQAEALRLNLATWVTAAQIAVQRGDSAGYQAALAAIERSVKRFFDPAAPARQAAEQAVTELKAASVSPQWPNLERSLKALAELEQRLAAPVAP